MLEFIILGSLYRKTLTGYDIRKCIDGGIGMFYKASYGSVYPLLGKLLEKGYVTCINELEGKREKKKYTITEAGKEAFFQWLNDDENENSSIEAFMAKVYYYDLLPKDVAYKKVNSYEEKLLNYYQELLKKKEAFDSLDNSDDYYFKLSTLYFGICKLQSIIKWCETVKSGDELETLLQQIERKGL